MLPNKRVNLAAPRSSKGTISDEGSPSLTKIADARPNKRLKLPAPAFKGSVMFVPTRTARRSLTAIR
jgi:hypothetical protein